MNDMEALLNYDELLVVVTKFVELGKGGTRALGVLMNGAECFISQEN